MLPTTDYKNLQLFIHYSHSILLTRLLTFYHYNMLWNLMWSRFGENKSIATQPILRWQRLKYIVRTVFRIFFFFLKILQCKISILFKAVFDSCKSISGKYFIFRKCYFPERKMFPCVWLHFKIFSEKYFLVFGKEEGKDKSRKTQATTQKKNHQRRQIQSDDK